MRRVARSVVCAGLFSLAASTHAAAEPVAITSGTLLLTGGFEVGSISLVGTQGFTFDARVTPGEGFIAPLHIDCSPLCEAGSTISLAGFLGGPAFVGAGTFAGNSFVKTGSTEDPADVFLEFSGSHRVPSDTGAPTMVTAPFRAMGGVVDGLGNAELIRAGGFVTLWLAPVPPDLDLPAGWTVSQMRYDFSTPPAPIPEPASMLLVGTGLALAALRRRTHRSARRDE